MKTQNYKSVKLKKNALLFLVFIISYSAPAQSVPYSLPTVGQAVSIGTNTANDIRPSGYSSGDWAYSLFNSFGTGAFVPDYSGAGAFVIAASGGHNAPGNVDAAIFDFANATWKRLPNANGITPREADYTASETNGAPYYELSGATAGQIPSPVHLYQSAASLPPSLGGGTKGSYLMLGSMAVVKESRQSGAIHKMDLATGLWTRVTNDQLGFSYSYVGSTVYDPVTKRYYYIHDAFHADDFIQYFDATDSKVKSTPTYPYPSGQQGPGYQTVFLDPVHRILIAQRRDFPLRALDLNNFSQGWVTLKVSGTQPAEFENRWAYYEPDGRFYTRGNKTGQTLVRLTPPSDWKTGTWTYSNVTIGGAAMPNHTTTGGEVDHYGTFFYVPAIQSLAWIAGESSKVIIMKPPTTITGTAGSKENESIANIYPNPASKNIVINLGPDRIADIEITNVIGKTIEVKKSVSGSCHLNIEGYESGLYLVRIISDDSVALHKFVRE